MEETKKKKEKWWLPDQEQFKGTWREDWRIMGQEGYLLNKQLQYRKFSREICFEDFTQCEFCWNVFDKDPAHPENAYYDPISKVWICEECYHDFLEHFNWTVIDNS